MARLSTSTAVTTEDRSRLMERACTAYYRADEDARSLAARAQAAAEKAERLRLEALVACGTAHLAP